MACAFHLLLERNSVPVFGPRATRYACFWPLPILNCSDNGFRGYELEMSHQVISDVVHKLDLSQELTSDAAYELELSGQLYSDADY